MMLVFAPVQFAQYFQQRTEDCISRRGIAGYLIVDRHNVRSAVENA